MLFRRRRIIPFLLGFLPVFLAGYFVFVFVQPAAAQTVAGTQVSDQCHILSRCAGNGLACSNDGQCTDGTKCRFDGIQLNIHIPGVTEMIADANGVKHPYVRNMSCFLADIYRYLAGVSGILAVVMMIYGGIKYVISFGNPSKLSDARDTISSAMIGLALVLGSYVILNFINPALTSLKVPYLTDIQKNEFYTLVQMCDASQPNQRNADGSPIKCGNKHLLYPNDPDEAKSKQACMGYYCGDNLQFCELTGRWEYKVSSEIYNEVFYQGVCRTTAVYTAVDEKDPQGKQYKIGTRDDDDLTFCGHLVRAMDFSDLNFYFGTRCGNHETCVYENLSEPILLYDLDLFNLSGDVEGFFCKDYRTSWIN